MQTFSGPANRCVRSPDNRAPRDDSDRKAARREARTFAMTKEVRAAGESLAHLSAQPPGKKSRAHRFVRCDTQSSVLESVPRYFPSLGFLPGCFPGRSLGPEPGSELARA